MSPKQANAGFGQKVMEKLETFRKGESKGALGRETLPPSPQDPRGLLPRTVLGGGLSVRSSASGHFPGTDLVL